VYLFVFSLLAVENVSSTYQESTFMQKYGQKAPMRSGKAKPQNRKAAMIGGVRVSGAKPTFPPK
tara:strand:- start:255 stop:446 length:192 start_codon:yes stop_codon:yes gene_type:complete